MGPYKAKKYPIEYKLDKDLLRLLSEANLKYGEYKTMRHTLEFDARYFLDSVLLTESYKSTQIEGTQISQDEMYYLKYLEKTDDNLEIQNLKKTIEYAYERIKFGENIFRNTQKNLSTEIRDLYAIILLICKSLSINLLDLDGYNEKLENGLDTIIDLLNFIDINEKNIKILSDKIYNAAKFNIKLMNKLHLAQETRYGQQQEVQVSYSTRPNKAVLVVGSNIRELETVLETFKKHNIDIYTHDDMMLAHTFPKFSEYENLKGQFGFGLENCLLDFATFPGPIILTKHSLNNIENFYRGRLFIHYRS